MVKRAMFLYSQGYKAEREVFLQVRIWELRTSSWESSETCTQRSVAIHGGWLCQSKGWQRVLHWSAVRVPCPGQAWLGSQG